MKKKTATGHLKGVAHFLLFSIEVLILLSSVEFRAHTYVTVYSHLRVAFHRPRAR